MKYQYLLCLFLLSLITSCVSPRKEVFMSSPNENICVYLKSNEGKLCYTINRQDEVVISTSQLSLDLKNMPPLGQDMNILAVEKNTVDETWQQVWGEEEFVRNNYNEVLVKLEEQNAPNRLLNIRFRVFNDGVGFRYEFPKQDGLSEFAILQENTEFNLPEDAQSWSIPSPAYKQRYYESLYTKQPVSCIADTVATPLTLKYANGLHVSIHEAALVDYAKMNLYIKEGNKLTSDLSPWSTGEKVFATAPFKTPWRTIIISGDASGLITSRLMLNLNEPNKIQDPNWIKPEKYIGVWWGMHMKEYTWAQGSKHGAKTPIVRKYIDFAAKNNITGVLVEGWNVGWDGNWGENGDVFRFDQPYDDFDIEYLSKYAKERGVKIIGHNETSGSTKNYESQLDNSFIYCNKYGISTIKTGYVNKFLDGKEVHDGQYGVKHMQKVVEMAAKYNICIVNHEPVMPTGVCRTWPNLLSQEGLRGQEWDAWSGDGGNPPSHTTILPFTRGLAGPMDFTPGTFNFKNPVKPQTRVQTTLAKQLALYVILYSPVQMASDMIENYENKPAFQFIRDVAVDWNKTIVPHAEIGEYITTIRKDKNSDQWFLGAITNEVAREQTIQLDFLTPGIKYKAQIYEDQPESDWKTNPTALTIRTQEVDSSTILNCKFVASGGIAIRFVPLN